MALSEADVGAVAFTTSTAAISCVFRERYSDFVVREVTLGGSEVRLVSEALPAAEVAAALGEAEEAASAAGLCALCGGDAALGSALEALLGAADGGGSPFVLLPASGDKAARTAQHRYCARLERATTDTVDDEADATLKRVRVWRKSGEAGGGGVKRGRHGGPKMDARSRADWPADRPPFCRFVLYKENADTMHAAGLFARALRCKQTSVGYAGTKDKRACTSQEVTVFKRTPAAIARAARDARAMEHHAIRGGQFAFVAEPLKLGDLGGNAFEVALRRARAGDGSRAALETAAADAARAVDADGFVNYFGLQRFGTGGTCNSLVGGAVLAAATGGGDWKRVVDLILAPAKADDEAAADAKRRYAAGDVAGAAERMPRQCRSEKQVLRALADRGDAAFLNAFQSLPKNLQLMYAHAHQSLVFNEAASARCAAHGPRPVAGDLVLARRGGGASSATPESSATERLRAGADVVRLTAEDVGNYSAFDVLLPLPGSGVEYPTFPGADAAYATKLDTYKSAAHPQYSLSGAYRHCFVRPANLRLRVVAYGARDAQLLATDDRSDAPPLDVAPGPDLALVASFALPTSSYATVCLREMTKQSFAKGHHAQKTEDHDAANAA